jgi:hypothetical protein
MGRYKTLQHKSIFLKGVFKNIVFACGVLIVSLAIGIIGYMYFFKLPWDDALLNASMILTGMGPVSPAGDRASKIFSSCYAIYSGVAFLTSVAVIFAPVLHRFLHRFHMDTET